MMYRLVHNSVTFGSTCNATLRVAHERQLLLFTDPLKSTVN